jgi:type II secretory pathway pseudopilin PulG
MIRIRHVLGFSYIELLVFIIVTSILMTVLLLASTTALRGAPAVQNQWVALETARGCMEWFVDQRRLNGYATITCPSTPSTSNCAVPSGFSASASVACTTWGGDSNYKTITVSVSGLSSASLSTQIGSY